MDPNALPPTPPATESLLTSLEQLAEHLGAHILENPTAHKIQVAVTAAYEQLKTLALQAIEELELALSIPEPALTAPTAEEVLNSGAVPLPAQPLDPSALGTVPVPALPIVLLKDDGTPAQPVPLD